MDTRKPAVAGRFYPGEKGALEGAVRSALVPAAGARRKALGVIVPHAGYIYSGAVAGRVFASIEVPERAVLLGPNHHGSGAPGAIDTTGQWETPLGGVRVDSGLARELARAVPELRDDPDAHVPEHSLEVELPFLQALNPQVSIVPIMLSIPQLSSLIIMGRKIGSILKTHTPSPLLVASSDMNHYEPHDATLEKDKYALDAVMALDEEALWKAVRDHRISMCGVQPVALMLAAAKEMGAKKAELLEHTTSGPVSGDYDHTVGYAGVIIS